MGFFSNLVEGIKSKSKEIYDKKAEEKLEEERLRKEMRTVEKIEFEKAFKESALKAARIKAQRDAANKTGLAKLRAMGRAKDLENPNRRGNLSKLSEYMAKNIARREQNLEKTKMLKEEAEKQRMGNKISLPTQTHRQPFSDLKRPLFKY